MARPMLLLFSLCTSSTSCCFSSSTSGGRGEVGRRREALAWCWLLQGVWVKPEIWDPGGRCGLPETGGWTGLGTWACREEGLVGSSRVRRSSLAVTWRKLNGWGSGGRSRSCSWSWRGSVGWDKASSRQGGRTQHEGVARCRGLGCRHLAGEGVLAGARGDGGQRQEGGAMRAGLVTCWNLASWSVLHRCTLGQ